MTYISGTLTDSNAPATLYGTVATALSTAGFTLVDTVVIGTRTHKVWKSAAGSNSAGLDWYLDVAYTTTGSGSIWFTPFEYYDPSSDLGYRGPYSAASATIESTYGSRYGATGYALETNWTPAAGVSTAARIDCPATSFAYWVSLTTNRVISICSGEPNYLSYVGLYELDSLYSSKVGSGAFPLISAKLDSSLSGSSLNIASSSLTRLFPGATVTGASGWGIHPSISGASGGMAATPSFPSGSTIAYPPVSNKVLLSVNSSASNTLARLGLLYDVVYANGTSVVRGDTDTIGSDTWVCTSVNTSIFYMFKAV